MTSVYIFPIYSPMIPMPSKVIPPSSQMEQTIAVQPATVAPLKQEIQADSSLAQDMVTMLMRKTMVPIRLTRRIGRTLNEVMPSQAKASIFLMQVYTFNVVCRV